jgi:hypothetical protein
MEVGEEAEEEESLTFGRRAEAGPQGMGPVSGTWFWHSFAWGDEVPGA